MSSSTVGPGTLSGKVAGGIEPATVITDAALTPTMGPVGNAADAAEYQDVGGTISFYTVRKGDNAKSVAEMFDIDTKTLYAANGMKNGQALKEGELLVILPLKGVQYTIKKGDTVKKIALATKADQSDIYFYNNLSANDVLNPGDTIIIPNGAPVEPAAAPTKKTATAPVTKKTAAVAVNTQGLVVGNNNGKSTGPITVHPMKDFDKYDLGTAILRPVEASLSTVTQFAHGDGKTGADIAAKLGTPILAPYDGKVIFLRNDGYNEGYGKYVIIMSTINYNGNDYPVQFILAHMSKIQVEIGQTVSRGEVIGNVGMTGDATGYHVHFEVRGALNPWTLAKNRNSNTDVN